MALLIVLGVVALLARAAGQVGVTDLRCLVHAAGGRCHWSAVSNRRSMAPACAAAVRVSPYVVPGVNEAVSPNDVLIAGIREFWSAVAVSSWDDRARDAARHVRRAPDRRTQVMELASAVDALLSHTPPVTRAISPWPPRGRRHPR